MSDTFLYIAEIILTIPSPSSNAFNNSTGIVSVISGPVRRGKSEELIAVTVDEIILFKYIILLCITAKNIRMLKIKRIILDEMIVFQVITLLYNILQ